MYDPRAGGEAEGEDGHAAAADRRAAPRRRARAPPLGDGSRRAFDRADAHDHTYSQRDRVRRRHAQVCPRAPIALLAYTFRICMFGNWSAMLV